MDESSVWVVLDFDNTVLDGNSDTLIFKGTPFRAEVAERARSGEQWTNLISDVLGKLWEQRLRDLDGKVEDVREEMEEKLRAMPIFEGMAELCRDIGHMEGVQLAILSDANDWFIETILRGAGIENFVVWSNCMLFEGSVPKIEHHGAHECGRCPVNLCKGGVLEREVLSMRPKSIFYAGDGRGDHCPILLLREGQDTAFVRKGWPLEACVSETPPKADVIYWDTGPQLAEAIRQKLPKS